MKFFSYFQRVLIVAFCYFQVQDLTVYSKSTHLHDDPCMVVRCRENTRCIAVPNHESCKTTSNCEMMAKCIPTGLQHPQTQQSNKIAYDPCIATLCMANTKCIAVPNPEGCNSHLNCDLVAKCIPIAPQQHKWTCGGRICQPGEKCELAPGMCIDPPCPYLPTCVPISPPGHTCKGYTCQPGETCETVQVQCFAPPCPPIPTCVPNKRGQQCGNQMCQPEETCEVVQVQCFAPPCPPMPTCVPKQTHLIGQAHH